MSAPFQQDRGSSAARRLLVGPSLRELWRGRRGGRAPGEILPGEILPGEILRGGDFVVVDVETTGWLDDAARITEIGAVRLSPGRPVAEFSSLVNPGVPIPPQITALTGITDAMVSTAPAIGEVLPRFLEFAEGCVLAAHHAPFDIGFLTAACQDCGIAWPTRAVVDTAALSRLVLGPDQVPDHKLATLSDFFATPTGPCHRALADARATLAVLTGLLRLLPAPGTRSSPAVPSAPCPSAGCAPTGAPPTATMAPQPGRGLPAHRRRLWSRRSF